MITKTAAASPLAAAFQAALADHPAAPPPGADAFLRAITADYRPEELPGISLADLAAQAASFWTFANAAGADAPAIRTKPVLGADAEQVATVVEIVQPDAPFLVDSVMAEIIEAGAGVLAMFHPIIETATGRRSTIQVWIEPLGEDRVPHLEAGLRATLADVRLADGSSGLDAVDFSFWLI